MSKARKRLILLTSLAVLAIAPAAAAKPTIVRAENADAVLQPGDILVNFQVAKPTVQATLIELAQRAIQKTAGVFRKTLRKGDARAVHVSLYVGGGQLAEAYGTKISDAKVNIWSVNSHPGEPYTVYRPRDRSLARRAVAVARRWATGRIRFKLPLHVLFRSSVFGPRARADALRFGRDASRSGGPRGVSSMFCSQFVLSAYQAAAVQPQLARNRRLSWRALRMPKALRLHAANASVLALLGQLRSSSDFTRGPEILVDPSLPPIPSILSRLGSEAKLLAHKLGLDRVAKTVRRGWKKVKRGAAKLGHAAKKAYRRVRNGARKVLKKAGSALKKAGKKVRSWFKKWF